MNKAGMCIAVGVTLLSSVFAADWPQFCGPDRNNVSKETGLADQWPEAGPKVLWEVPVASGYSGPAIHDGKVYLIDRDGENSLLRCLSLEDGKELWVCSFADPGVMDGKKYEGTRGTPTITESHAYLVTGFGLFVCVDLTTHAVVWSKNLLTDYSITLDKFGMAQSPVIHGKLVLIAPHASEVGVAAYDKLSGERIWVSSSLGIHSFTSPQVVTICGREMVVAAGSASKADRKRKDEPETSPAVAHVVGLAVENGSVLWDFTGWQCSKAIPFPVLVEDNRLFLTGGYDVESVMIQIVKEDTGFVAKELYRTDKVGSQTHQPVQVGKHLFIGSNSNSRNDGLACFNLDGKLEWRTKDIEGAPIFGRGSFILADKKLILLDGETGILYLVKADVSGYKQLASAKMVKEKDMAWAPLALSNGKLLVRDWNLMKCVELK